MEKDTLILANGYLLTCDPVNRGGRYHLVVREGRIAEISEDLEPLTSLFSSAQVVDCAHMLITPGFINGHFHSESILAREATDAKHFGLWAHDRAFRDLAAALVDPEHDNDLRNLWLAASVGHLKSGTTTVGEVPLPVGEKSFSTLIGVMRLAGLKSVVALRNWDQIRRVRENPETAGKVAVSLGKEDEYTVYSFENLVRAGTEMQVPLLAHIAEQREDVDVVRRNFRKHVLAVLRDYGALQRGTVLVHLNHAGSEDLELVEAAGGSFVLCARSAAFKQTGCPVLRRIDSRHVRISLGTDWGALDMLGEMRFVQQLPLLFPGIPSFTPMQLLRMATVHGAFALGVYEDTGSVEQGKAADLIFFDLNHLHSLPISMTPSADELADLLVNRLTARDILHVMVDGVYRVRNGNSAVAEADVMKGFQESCERLYPSAKRTYPRTGKSSAWAEQEQHRSKAVPLIPKDRVPAPDLEGFVEGFSIVKKPELEPGSGNTVGTAAVKDGHADRPAVKPELAKDVKRVFGDDEES